MSRSSQRPSDPAYYIEDCRISCVYKAFTRIVSPENAIWLCCFPEDRKMEPLTLMSSLLKRIKATS